MNSDYDWFRFRVNFVFGAVVGAIIGGLSWVQHWFPGSSPFLWICGWSLGIALTGGIYGDRFWDWFLRNILYLRWW
jgi:F0F1-type ATP synthase assembly protein I